MPHAVSPIDVSPEEVDGVVQRLEHEQCFQLAIVGPGFSAPNNPESWPEELKGKVVYRLRTPSRSLIDRVTSYGELRDLALIGLGLSADDARTIAERLSQLTSLSIWNNRVGEAGAHAIAERLSQLTSLHIGGNRIGNAGARAIAERLARLTSLDIWNCSVGKTGAQAIALGLSQLTSLDVGYNPVGKDGARAIAERLAQLTSLGIRNSQLGEAGARAIAERPSPLESLDIGGNQIGDVGARELAERLWQLTSLDIGGNRVGDAGARAIAEGLPQLTSLDIGYNQVGEAGARAIAERLSQLTCLKIGDNQVGAPGARAIAERLSQLTSLDIGSNQVGKAGARAIAERLLRLTSLNIGDNQVRDAGARAIASGLSQLTSLGIGNNQIGEPGARAIAEGLPRLTALSIRNNQLGEDGVRVIAARLERLTNLDVQNSGLGDEGVLAIGQKLPALRHLNLSENRHVTSLSPLSHLDCLSSLRIQSTSVSDLSPFAARISAGWPVIAAGWPFGDGVQVDRCPLQRPPIEIAGQGPEAVRNYFVELERQSVARLQEAKVLIVGDGGSGKTSLLRRLYRRHLPLPAQDETTRGIDIHRQDFSGGSGPFRLNIWDFGGQQIYHATHQFFLTKSSLYVLVDDTKKSDKSIQDDSFKFWFEVVETLSERSPLLIFQNEKGGRSKLIDLAGIKGRFPNVLGVYAGNLERPDSADPIRSAIQFHVQQLPHVGSEVPAKWIAVREALEAEATTKPFISQDEYFVIYGRHLPFDRTKALHLSQYLHDLGVFLHFQDDPQLRKTVILQNQWATDAVFRVLDDEGIKKASGRFTSADCERAWAEPRYADMQTELIGLMKKFELCYQLSDTNPERWLAPQLLMPSRPGSLQDWARPSDLVVRFRYPFLPRGLVSRLMVRQHRFVKQLDRAWARGAFFEHEGTQALVQEGASGNEIEVRARGPEHKALLSVLASDLEAINHTFLGLRDRLDKLVPCICTVCRTTTDPDMYRQSELIERKSKNKKTIECRREPYEDVNVLTLLDGIEVAQLPEWARAQPNRPAGRVAVEPIELTVFLASSKELKEDRDAFELYCRQQNDRLRRQGIYLTVVRWENFLDAMSDTRLQDDYNRRVRESDIFVSLFQTMTGQFTGEEFDTAFDQFKKTGKPRIYTYFRETTVSLSAAKREDLISLWDFKDKLTALGHFVTQYESAEHLKRHFKDQLEKLLDELPHGTLERIDE